MKMQVTLSPEVRELSADEIHGVSGGILPILIGITLFEVGFVAGAIACNVANGQPWWTNDFEY